MATPPSKTSGARAPDENSPRLANPYGLTYASLMSDVVTTGEARDALHQIARRFDAGEGEPVYFGSHRRAQAVIVPVDVWERLLKQAEDELDAEVARNRLAEDARKLSHAELTSTFERIRSRRGT